MIRLRFLTRDEARDWAAILYTPVLTICGIGQTVVMVWGPWPPETAAQRLQFLGWSLIINLALIAFGVFFLQRRTVDIKGTLPGGATFEIDNVPSADPPVR